MGWAHEVRKAGYDPNTREDATEDATITIPDRDSSDWIALAKGSVIGDPTQCIGARCTIWSIPDADWAFLGAQLAVVHYKDGRLLRYEHSGIIPKTQDEGHFPRSGVYRLGAPRPGRRLGVRKPSGPHETSVTNPRNVSIAAQMRS